MTAALTKKSKILQKLLKMSQNQNLFFPYHPSETEIIIQMIQDVRKEEEKILAEEKRKAKEHIEELLSGLDKGNFKIHMWNITNDEAKLMRKILADYQKTLE